MYVKILNNLFEIILQIKRKTVNETFNIKYFICPHVCDIILRKIGYFLFDLMYEKR